jgi:UDP-N-acetylmuramoyl-L-alanyl-D-glutamate--2,6-diaminopimelate ligase
MRFSELTKDIGIKSKADFEVAGIAIDSRLVKENYIFFGLKGENADGADFVEAAIKNGAKAVFTESPIKLNNVNISNVILSSGKDCVDKLNVIAERFYTPLPENLVAVTGTNGKTSVANFTASLISILGRKSASIGTLGTLLDGDFEKQFSYSGLTSPDIITLLKDLSGLKKKDVNYAVMETSSHGLHQGRMGNLKFKVGSFTNFTQDHLDYHKTMNAYFEAKMLLFRNYIEKGGTAVINADIPEIKKIKSISEEAGLKVITYGKYGDEIKIKEIRPHGKGLDIEAEIFGKDKIIKTSLIGRFQAHNVLCAIGNVIALGFDVDKVCDAAAKLKPVKGRMDVIPFEKRNAKIVIDYAHTPDALEKAIDSLRIHTSGRLITLFGCGGDRDKTKRPLMGEIAQAKSDVVIVTDDNPRTENAAYIRKEILVSASKAQEVAGRKEAIEKAISMLEDGDSLLLAGKGHEDYQIIGKEKFPFDEFKIVKEIIGKI